jgi:hypothetical protein
MFIQSPIYITCSCPNTITSYNPINPKIHATLTHIVVIFFDPSAPTTLLNNPAIIAPINGNPTIPKRDGTHNTDDLNTKSSTLLLESPK